MIFTINIFYEEEMSLQSVLYKKRYYSYFNREQERINTYDPLFCLRNRSRYISCSKYIRTNTPYQRIFMHISRGIFSFFIDIPLSNTVYILLFHFDDRILFGSELAV